MVLIGVLTAFSVCVLLAVGLAAAQHQYQDKSSLNWAIAISLIVLLSAGVVVALYVKAITAGRKLLRWGHATEGLVTTMGKVDSAGVVRRVTYQFLDASGKLMHGKSQVRTPVEGVITVLYDPNNPKRNCAYPVVGFEVSVPGS
jgi:hypothetical protein